MAYSGILTHLHQTALIWDSHFPVENVQASFALAKIQISFLFDIDDLVIPVHEVDGFISDCFQQFNEGGWTSILIAALLVLLYQNDQYSVIIWKTYCDMFFVSAPSTMLFPSAATSTLISIILSSFLKADNNLTDKILDYLLDYISIIQFTSRSVSPLEEESQDTGRCLHLFVQAFEQLHNSVENCRAKIVIRENQMEWFESVITLIEFNLFHREYLIKKLFLVLLRLCDGKLPESTVRAVWPIASSLCTENNFPDNLNRSALLCILISNVSISFTILQQGTRFWDLVLSFFLSSELLIRKRAAYIMEYLPPSIKTDDARAMHDPVPVTSTKHPKDKKKKGSKPSAIDNLHQDKAWWEKFLIIYHQVEGCKDNHLVSQVWSLIDDLFEQLMKPNTSTAFDDLEGHPELRFAWMKVIINGMLNGQVPSIRKLILFRLLSRQLPLPWSNVDVLTWLADELIPKIDDSTYFSSNRLSQESLVNYISDGSFHEVLQDYDPSDHPGILLPSCLYHVIVQLVSEPSSHSSLASFTKSLIASMTNLSSYTAAKWLYRLFEDMSKLVDQPVLDILSSIASTLDMRQLRSFYQRSIVCCNEILRQQIVPGHISCYLMVFPLIVDGHDELEAICSIARFLIDVHGVEVLKNNPAVLSLFLRKIDKLTLSYHHRLASLNLQMIDFDELLLIEDYPSTLALIAISIYLYTTHVDHSYVIDELWKESLSKMVAIANALYDHPYMELSKQRSAIEYLAATPRLSHILSTSKKLLLFYDHYHRALDYHSIASYMDVILQQSLSSLLASSNGNDSLLLASSTAMSSMHVIDSLDVWDSSCYALVAVLSHALAASSRDSIHYQTASSKTHDLLSIILNRLHQHINSNHSVSFIVDYLLLRYISILMPAIISSSINLVDDSVSKLIADSFNHIFHLSAASSAVFQTASDHLQMQGSNHLHHNFFEIFPNYSNYSSSFIDYKWQAANLLVQALSLQSSSHQPSEACTSTILTLDVLIDAIDVSTEKSFIETLRCAKSYLSLLPSSCYQDDLGSKVISLLHTSWNVCINSVERGVNMMMLQAFIEFVYSPATMDLFHSLPANHIEDMHPGIFYFQLIIELGMKHDRSYLIQYLSAALYELWYQRSDLSLAFFPVIDVLLLYREHAYDETSLSDSIIIQPATSLFEEKHAYINGMVISRVLMLKFLEDHVFKIINANLSPVYQSAIDQLACRFIAMNMKSSYRESAIIGSTYFCEKLRCWQTLCILVQGMSISAIERTLGDYFLILTHICAHQIRVHMEIYGAVIAIKYPELFYKYIVVILQEYHHQQQVLSSYFIILGHTITSSPKFSCHRADQIIHLLMPWLSCANGLPRVIAQYLMVYLIPIVIHPNESSLAIDNARSADAVSFSMLQSIYSFLTENKESYKIIERQKQFFVNYGIEKLTNVKGLLSLMAQRQSNSNISSGNSNAFTRSADMLADHLLTKLLELIKENSGLSTSNEAEKIIESSAGASSASSSLILQTKRIPFNDLLLHLSEDIDEKIGLHRAMKSKLVPTNSKAASQRNPIIVIASLLDKATNIAGKRRSRILLINCS
jgi:hypothetical protein